MNTIHINEHRLCKPVPLLEACPSIASLSPYYKLTPYCKRFLINSLRYSLGDI